jgi:hypothetical protein
MRPLFLAALLAPAVALAGEVSEATITDVTRRFAAELSCAKGSKDPNRAWCPVTAIGKGAFKPARQNEIQLGFSASLKDGAKVSETLANSTELAVLYLGPTEARLTSLTPSTPDEQKQLAAVVFELAKRLKGMAKGQVELPADLGGFVTMDSRQQRFPLTVSGASASFPAKLPSRIFRSGDAFVVIEQADGGVRVSVFPTVGFKIAK